MQQLFGVPRMLDALRAHFGTDASPDALSPATGDSREDVDKTERRNARQLVPAFSWRAKTSAGQAKLRRASAGAAGGSVHHQLHGGCLITSNTALCVSRTGGQASPAELQDLRLGLLEAAAALVHAAARSPSSLARQPSGETGDGSTHGSPSAKALTADVQVRFLSMNPTSVVLNLG